MLRSRYLMSSTINAGSRSLTNTKSILATQHGGCRGVTKQVGSLDRGGQAAAVHYSLMASCKANEVEPFAYLRDVLARITDHAVDRLEELLPDQWLKQHPEAHRPRRR